MVGAVLKSWLHFVDSGNLRIVREAYIMPVVIANVLRLPRKYSETISCERHDSNKHYSLYDNSQIRL